MSAMTMGSLVHGIGGFPLAAVRQDSMHISIRKELEHERES